MNPGVEAFLEKAVFIGYKNRFKVVFIRFKNRFFYGDNVWRFLLSMI